MPEGTSREAIEFPRRRQKYPRLPDQVEVQFGPADVIANAILALDLAVRERGVYLSLSTDLHELVGIDSLNPPGWAPLRPVFDPNASDIPNGQAFWIRGTDEDGNIVLTHCGRLFSWPGTTSLRDEVQSLHFFYRDPQQRQMLGENCVAETMDMSCVTGRVVFGGAHWVHPKMRGRGLAYFAPRITRAIGLTTWYMDYAASMAHARYVANGIDKTYGWRHVDNGIVRWSRPAANEFIEARFGWMTRDEVVEDLEEFTLLLRHSPTMLAV
jgi:hypothetical protein